MVHPEDREDAEGCFRHACASSAAFTLEYRLLHVSKRYVAVMAGAVPSISPVDRSFIGYIGTINEVDDTIAGSQTRVGEPLVVPPTEATKPQTPVDMIADYLLLARSTAIRAGEDRLLASIDFAISEVMRRLGHGSAQGRAH